MRKVREILRLRFERGLSHRQISASTGVSKGALSEYLRRAADAGVTWEVARDLDDGEVEARLFRLVGRNEPPRRVAIDLPWVHRELRRTGVTLQQLWLEYRDAAAQSMPSGGTPYGYSQFCDLARSVSASAWICRCGRCTALERRSSSTTRARSRASGRRRRAEAIEVELYVAVLERVELHVRGGDAHAAARGFLRIDSARLRILRRRAADRGAPDQLRSAVSGPDRYDPEINPTYAELAQHYDVAIVPARPAKPRDKAKVEAAVLLAQRWILACLRNRTFLQPR